MTLLSSALDRVALAAALLIATSVSVSALGGPTSTVPTEVATIYARTAPDYKRKKQSNGAWAREYYAIANAGAAAGSMQDSSVNEVAFSELAGSLAQHLGRQGYFLAKDSRQADILLVVHWGRSITHTSGAYTGAMDSASSALSQLSQIEPAVGFRSPLDTGRMLADPETAAEANALDLAVEDAMITIGMQNRQRDVVNQSNAVLLGYIDAVNDYDDIRRWAGGGAAYDDLIGDLEEPRYYINISAYDFRRATERGERKLLWQTKLSLRYRGNSFAERFNDMLASATRYYGQHHRDLIRRDLREVRVEIGQSEVVGVAAPPAGSESR